MKDNKKIDFRLFYNSMTRSKGLWFDDEESSDDDLEENILIISNFDDDEGEEKSYLNGPISIFEDYKKARDIFFENSTKNKKLHWNSSKSAEDKVKETIEEIKANKSDIIVNGALEYNDAVSTFYALDLKSMTLYVETFSIMPVAKDILKAYFAYGVVNGYFKPFNKSLACVKFICRSEEEKYELRKFYFKFTEHAVCLKARPNNMKRTLITKKFGFVNACNLKYLEDFEKSKLINMFDTLTLYEIGIPKRGTSNSLEVKESQKCVLNPFNGILTYIKGFMNHKFDKNDYLEKPILFYIENKSSWGDNPHFNDLYAEIFPEYAGIQGNFIPRKKLLDELTKGDLSLALMAKKYLNVKEQFIIPDREKLQQEIEKLDNKKVVWYDYESISLPYAIVENSRPYQQIVFQVSIIKSKNNKIYESKDIVYDPKTINVMDFVDNFYQLYEENADQYVVYNKGFENTRNDEMIVMIEQAMDDPEFAKKVSDKYNLTIVDLKNMVQSIKEKTYDLADIFDFRITNPKTTGATEITDRNVPLLYIPYLRFYYSIKKVEKFVSNNPEIKLEHKIKKYENLDIKNGMYAQEAGIKRYLGDHKDNVWKEVAEKLKEYCHNDVMAMLMAFDLVKYCQNKYKSK
ncbi:Domain of uncharacterised function(DUF2779) [Mycoplasmopsis californica]|uniref:DUF2779 domain-containing protein n=1 Tax=Mycoplasmopsis equigenitalium TaxID=114883 RepID=A0ABY5J122_9BACT|nr:DUF2779 domain-containing protein [Mycoplasmopsis equigenitalium]UUD36919.1 DUF2779 domain-containing protein [Mycoplasmopsis equigenitalium]VEU69786.1 Domain of uncharacterised function(DUF2779) [Mycoplasmopsis californica]